MTRDVGGAGVVGVDVGVDAGDEDAGGEGLEGEGIAVDEGQLLDGALLDDEALRGGLGLELLDAGGDFDGLSGRADVEGDVLLVGLVDVDDDVGALGGFEAGERRRRGCRSRD